MNKPNAPVAIVQNDKNGLTITMPHLSITRFSPALLLFDEQNESEIWQTPDSFGFSKTSERVTPLGISQCSMWQWQVRDGLYFEWTIGQLPSRNSIFLEANIKNRTTAPISIRDIYLGRTADHDCVVDGEADEWVLMFNKDTPSANLAAVLSSRNERFTAMYRSWNQDVPYELPSTPKFNDGHWRMFRDICTLFSHKSQEGMVIAAVDTVADLDIDWRVESTRCRLEIISRMTDSIVPPGTCRKSETALIRYGRYHEAMEDTMHWIGANHGTRTHRKPIVGWCSWYDRHRNIDADHILSVTHTIQKMHPRIQMDVIQIDDGYQRAMGDWVCNEQFSGGWKEIVETIEHTSSTPGVWIAPLWFYEDVRYLQLDGSDKSLVERHPDWFQRDRNGNLAGKDPKGKLCWLDPSHPDVQTFIRRNLRDLRAAGFRYFKTDFNTLQEKRSWHPQAARFHDRSKTRFQIFRDLYAMYREELGEDTYLLACVCEYIRGPIGFADAQRIGPDSSPTWESTNHCCLHESIQAVGANAIYHNRLLTADPDVTYMFPRSAMTIDELRAWHGIVGLLGGATYISEPLNEQKYRDETALYMFEILTPPNPEKGLPLDPGTDPENRRFGFLANRPWGSFLVMNIYNPDNAPTSIPINCTSLSNLGKQFHAWSFWDSRYIGLIDHNYHCTDLPPHAGNLLRLTPETDIPVLVGSSLHITMGVAEIQDIAITASVMAIHLVPGAGARSGELCIFSPRPMKLDTFCGCSVRLEKSAVPGIWSVLVENRSHDGAQVITLDLE